VQLVEMETGILAVQPAAMETGILAVQPMVSCHNLAIGRAPVVEEQATRSLAMQPVVMETGSFEVLGFVFVDHNRFVAVVQVVVELNHSLTDLVAATATVHILVVRGFERLVLMVESRFVM
jgi:hypothetical protein